MEIRRKQHQEGLGPHAPCMRHSAPPHGSTRTCRNENANVSRGLLSPSGTTCSLRISVRLCGDSSKPFECCVQKMNPIHFDSGPHVEQHHGLSTSVRKDTPCLWLSQDSKALFQATPACLTCKPCGKTQADAAAARPRTPGNQARPRKPGSES